MCLHKSGPTIKHRPQGKNRIGNFRVRSYGFWSAWREGLLRRWSCGIGVTHMLGEGEITAVRFRWITLFRRAIVFDSGRIVDLRGIFEVEGFCLIRE